MTKTSSNNQLSNDEMIKLIKDMYDIPNRTNITTLSKLKKHIGIPKHMKITLRDLFKMRKLTKKIIKKEPKGPNGQGKVINGPNLRSILFGNTNPKSQKVNQNNLPYNISVILGIYNRNTNNKGSKPNKPTSNSGSYFSNNNNNSINNIPKSNNRSKIKRFSNGLSTKLEEVVLKKLKTKRLRKGVRRRK